MEPPQIAAQGLHRGAYHFLDPHESGEAQAQYFVSEHAKLGTTPADMFWLDNETAGASPAETAACAVAFMAELGKLVPHNPRGVYTYIDFARQGNCDGLSGYPLWLAYPNATAPASPPPWHRWTFWQWGSAQRRRRGRLQRHRDATGRLDRVLPAADRAVPACRAGESHTGADRRQRGTRLRGTCVQVTMTALTPGGHRGHRRAADASRHAVLHQQSVSRPS